MEGDWQEEAELLRLLVRAIEIGLPPEVALALLDAAPTLEP